MRRTRDQGDRRPDERITDASVKADRQKAARAKSGLDQAEVAVAKAQLELARARVTAPFGGRVANVKVPALAASLRLYPPVRPCSRPLQVPSHLDSLTLRLKVAPTRRTAHLVLALVTKVFNPAPSE